MVTIRLPGSGYMSFHIVIGYCEFQHNCPNIKATGQFLLNTMTTLWFPWKPMPLAPAQSRPLPACRVWPRSVRKRPRRCGTDGQTDGQTDGRTNPNYSMMLHSQLKMNESKRRLEIDHSQTDFLAGL